MHYLSQQTLTNKHVLSNKLLWKPGREREVVGGTWKSLLIDTMVHRHKIFKENKILWHYDCDITNKSNDSRHSLYLTPNKKLSRITQGINPLKLVGLENFEVIYFLRVELFEVLGGI